MIVRIRSGDNDSTNKHLSNLTSNEDQDDDHYKSKSYKFKNTGESKLMK